jgi:large subunit ribosomal protein L9
MDIILLEKIEGHGKIGDIIKVKNGFARNYLFPLKKALRATKENIKFFETKKSEIEHKNNEAIKAASDLGKKIDNLSLIIIRQAGDSGHLYGSVSSKDIAEALNQKGFKVDSHCIRISNPIKEIGIFSIQIALHTDVVVSITVNVARSEDEAKSAIKVVENIQKEQKEKSSKPVKKDKIEKVDEKKVEEAATYPETEESA